MTHKSRQSRSRRKGRKSRQHLPAIAAQRQETSEIEKPLPEPAVSVPSESVPTSMQTQIQHPFITNELRRIGILGGVMLVILVVLALVFA